jgi:hypothetical protein
LPKVYQDDLWYPILVPVNGYCRIVEMQGKDVNRYNEAIYETKNTKTSEPRCTCIDETWR